MEAVIFVFCALAMCGLVSPAQDTGYPAGLMAECPGMNFTTTLSEKTRASLSVVVMWPTGSLLGHGERRCNLSARGAECVARYLDLKKRKTQVLISGYMDATFSPIVRTLAEPYLALGRNVLIVENFPVLVRSYPLAARVTKPIGVLVGEMLAELTRRGLRPNKLALVGASLGAHIAAQAAAKYTHITGRRPARLTGLDPAGPCFRSVPDSERFNRDAARRVDALHTNIDGFGIADAIAQVDFYANGGEYQPSMTGDFLLPCFTLCSHIRAALYWIVAHDHPDQFVAVRCPSVAAARHGSCYNGHVETNLLGLKTNFSRPGIYYLPTTDAAPYYVGKNGVKKRLYGVNDYLAKLSPDENVLL